MEYLHQTSSGIGLLGVALIVLGGATGLGHFIRSEVHSARGVNVDGERKELRHLLGYYLLLGLEFIIAADIIDTLMEPMPNNLLVLGVFIVIRTAISYSLSAALKSAPQHQTAAP